jgi:hypothetical protein
MGVIAGVVGDDGAAADEIVVLVEEETGHGKLSRAGLAMGEARDWSEVPCSTLLVGTLLDDSLRASLGPGHDLVLGSLLRVQAGLAEHREIDGGIVAAGLLANWASGHLLVGLSKRAVHYSGEQARLWCGGALEARVDQSSEVWATKEVTCV